MCLVIYAYGDDGADEKRERVIAVSVIAGYEEWWEEFEDQWRIRCGGIPFHAKDCESDQGDYRGMPHEQNKAMYADLTGILAASKLGGLGVALDITAQRRIFPNALDLAYYRAFVECFSRASIVGENYQEIVKLTFDISRESEYKAALLYKVMREGDPRLSKWLHPEISFIAARDSARLQAADLLSFEAWKALDHTVGPVKRTRRSWQLLRATGRFETLSYSQDWFADLKRHIESGDLERKVNFTQKDYENWLREKRRHHDLSNLFEFIDAMTKRDEKT
jgi:hypothetical protein